MRKPIRHLIILLGAVGALLTVGVGVAWPRIEFWRLTGHFTPIRNVETLQHPVAVTNWGAGGLVLADGRTVRVPRINELPEDSVALREALKRGVEIGADGRVWGLVRIHHWCGNDPVREHVARVDLSEMMIFLRIGKAESPGGDETSLVREPGGRFSEFGWEISEYMEFQAWESLKNAARY